MLYEEKGRILLFIVGEKVIVGPAGQPWIVGNFPVREFAPEEWHQLPGAGGKQIDTGTLDK